MALEDHVSEANPGCCSFFFPPSISIMFVRELELGKERELQPHGGTLIPVPCFLEGILEYVEGRNREESDQFATEIVLKPQH